jgi:hypothetical protein
MSTKSISTLEAKVMVLEAKVNLMEELMEEMKEQMKEQMGGASEKVEKKKGERKKRDPDAPKPERSEKQKAQDEKRGEIKSFLSDDQKKELKEAGYKGNVVFSLGAYISENNNGDDISAEMVAAAVNYLVENPDYKSKTQKERSEKGSVTGSDSEEKVEKKKPGRPKAEKSPVTSDGEEKVENKGRGRPKKEKGEKSEKGEKKIEVVSPSDDGDEKAEEWEFAGEQFYKLTKSNAVIDTDFEYVGIYDGKKIDRKAEMPPSVKKYLEQFN